MSAFRLTRRRQGSKAFTRRQDVLLKDLRFLSARASRAIRDGDKQATGDVLRLFESLVLEAIEHHAARAAVSSDLLLPRDGSGVHSREWRELMQMLVDVEEAASLAPTRRVRSDVLNSILRIVNRFIRAQHFEAARQVIAAMGWMWSAIDADQGTWDAEDEDYFLMRIREASSLGAPRPKDLARASATADIYLSAYATLARTSIERGHWDNAADVLKALAEAGDYTPDNLYEQGFGPRRRALALALFAWMLLVRRDEVEAESAVDCTSLIAAMFRDSPLWEALNIALDEDFQRSLGISWWEMNRRTVRGLSAGFIEIDRYIRIAALVLAGRTSRWGLPDTATESAADLASALLHQLDQLEGDPNAGILADIVQRPHPWREELQRLLAEREERRNRALAETPLDDSRIERFRNAIDAALVEAHGIGRSLDGVHRPSGLSPTFGFNRLEPKVWFAPSHVHANPEELGRGLIDGIRRGEDSRIVTAIFESRPPAHTTVDDLSSTIAAWVSQHARERGTVLVTNSWRAGDVLRALSGATGSYSSAEPESIRISDKELTLHRLFDSRDPFVAAAVSPGGITVTIGWQEAEDDPGVHVHDHRIVSTVRPPTDHELLQWRQSNLTHSDDLEQQVVVKVLEAFDVTVVDPQLLGVWSLPIDEF